MKWVVHNTKLYIAPGIPKHMGKILHLFLILGILSLSACNVLVNDFESCAAAGNPVMESYPRQCNHDGKTYVEQIEVDCQPEQRDVDACASIYNPVCAKVNVVCVRAPCDPVWETFPNTCEACKNDLVESYVRGECK